MELCHGCLVISVIWALRWTSNGRNGTYSVKRVSNGNLWQRMGPRRVLRERRRHRSLNTHLNSNYLDLHSQQKRSRLLGPSQTIYSHALTVNHLPSTRSQIHPQQHIPE